MIPPATQNWNPSTIQPLSRGQVIPMTLNTIYNDESISHPLNLQTFRGINSFCLKDIYSII